MEVSCSSDMLRVLLQFALSRSAEEIVIEIENGGITEVKVCDNGIGIENIPQCVQQGIFREIYPYCKLHIKSKPKESSSGYSYLSMFGHLCDYKEVQCEEGTEICIMDLFFNLPDKYRKLKKDCDEREQIIHAACEFYILHGLSMKLLSGKRVIFNLPSVKGIEERISFLPTSYYGKRIAAIQYTCGAIYILKLKGTVKKNILEKGNILSEEERSNLKALLDFDKTLLAIISLKENAKREDLKQMIFEIQQRLEQWKLNKERNSRLSINASHKSMEKEILLRAKVVKGEGHSDSPHVSMDNNELTIVLPNGMVIIIPIRQLGY